MMVMRAHAVLLTAIPLLGDVLADHRTTLV
jgi:hypothetical protein